MFVIYVVASVNWLQWSNMEAITTRLRCTTSLDTDEKLASCPQGSFASHTENFSKIQSRKRRLALMATSGSVCSMVCGLVTIVCVLQYKIVPLMNRASLQRTNCYITGIYKHIFPVEPSFDSDVPASLEVDGDNSSAPLYTCASVDVLYEKGQDTLLPGILLEHPFQRSSVSKVTWTHLRQNMHDRDQC